MKPTPVVRVSEALAVGSSLCNLHSKKMEVAVRLRTASLLPVIALVALLGAESAFACSCVPPDTKKLLPGSDAAVVGRLVAVIPRSQAEADYKYRVRLVIKGSKRGIHRGQLLTVRSAQDEAACGLPPGLGRSYGLFLDHAAGSWSSSRCQVVSPEEMREAGRSGTSTARPSGCG